MSDIHEVILIDEQKSSKEILSVSTVGSYEFENTELTGLWVDSDTGKLEIYTKLQPQLTIPQSIADKLDKFIEIDFDDVGHEDWWIQENGLIEWFSKTPNCYIKDTYLAGKAFGVDLVKVVEG